MLFVILGILHCKQNISNTIGARALKFGELIGNDEQMTWLLLLLFDLGFTALSRIFHLYRADRSSKVGENRRTRGKTT